jgi:glycerophosphoryl diester phosphodiesterase
VVTPSPTSPERDPDPVIAIAHRGDPIDHRENTLPAFAAALALGADMLELDLRRTRDGTIVVLHDQSLLRLWEHDASVGDLDVSDVARLGEGDTRIPTLRQLLDAVPVDVDLMVDFTRREVVPGALDQALSAGALDRCLFVTGNVEALRMLRGLSGRARIGLTWTEGTDPPLPLLDELDAEYWNPTFSYVTAAGVDAVHEAGLRVSTWTVDAPEDMERVVSDGVDAVVSNRVADLVAFLGR